MTWSALLVAGWTLYELTTQPALAAVVVCLKFGWEDFRTAIWLRRVDPYRPRAKACFALYVASGLWKTAVTASIMLFAIVVVTAIAPERAGPRPQDREGDAPAMALGSMLAATIGYTLLAFATCRTLWLSLRYRIKLWLDGSVHRARRRSLWPPSEMWEDSTNRALRVLLTALVVLGFPLLMSVIGSIMMYVAPPGAVRQANGQGREAFFAIIGLVMPIAVSAVVFLGLRDFLSRRVVALTPWDCWGYADLEEDFIGKAEPGFNA